MLEGLDKIDWENLAHAYGSAEDVPALIRRLASADSSERQVALTELYGNIWHQGTVYEASAFAVPFLIELVQNEAVQDRERILILLADLATGNSYWAVHGDLEIFKAERERPDFQEKLERELSGVRSTREAVRSGSATYLNLLHSQDPETRAAAANCLGCFPDLRTEVL